MICSLTKQRGKTSPMHGMGMKAPCLFWRVRGSNGPWALHCWPFLHLTGTGVHAILILQQTGGAAAVQTVRIYRLKDLDRRTRARLKSAQLEAARVWMYCLERHQQARSAHVPWP